jgi:hypothetical protein
VSRVLNFSEPQLDICEEFDLRLKLRFKEASWVSSIMAANEWIKALEPIELRAEQMVFYKAARYFVHHYKQIPTWPLKHPKTQSEDLVAPLDGYPPELVPTKLEVKHAIEWFLSPDRRGSGRSYLLAVCFIELASANREISIRFWDHHGWGRNDYMSTMIRDIVWDVLDLKTEIVVNAIEVIRRADGASEINKRGTW